jgi:hypothetical protein
MGTPDCTRRCMAISTSVVSGASERPEATIEAGMSGTSGRLFKSNLSMVAIVSAPGVGILWRMFPTALDRRHARPRAGHPRICSGAEEKDMDGRDKPGHDEEA